jgi:sulfonate transport system substrate-binding protein
MKTLVTLVSLTAIFVLAACGGSNEGSSATGSTGGEEKVTLRLGYFPNITHSQPIIGLQRGTVQAVLGSNVDLKPQTFNAGPAAIEALFAGAIDATYIGPNPAINGYEQSDGKALRIVAGATSGGALLVVRPEADIKEPKDFANKKVASPQLGNTQDVALRAWLLDNGLAAKESGGNVQVLATANPDTLNLFKQGDIDAAWVPEPWATRLVQEAGGEIFLDERDLWPGRSFVTTHLIVATDFLERHSAVVKRLIQANVETTLWIKDNQAEAKQLVNKGIEKATGAALSTVLIDAAWPNLEATYDPLTASLFASANSAKELGFIRDVPDRGIYALDPLNQVLAEKGLPSIQVDGGT